MANSASSPADSVGSGKWTNTPHAAVDNLSALSNDILVSIAKYLPKTSRALLAVALTAPPSSWREGGWKGQPSDAGRAVLAAWAGGRHSSVLDMNSAELKDSSIFRGWPEGLAREKELQKTRMREYYTNVCYYGGRWGVLDFLDLDAGLASKLTDDDVGAILTCIDARTKLQKLHLTKCSSVVGDGLEPIRGSSVLRHIDFDIQTLISFLDKSYTLSFSQEKAFSVLGSILAGDTNSFQTLQVPRKWMGTKQKEQAPFAAFLAGHKHFLNMSAGSCHFGFRESEEDVVNQYIGEQGDAGTEFCVSGHSGFMSCSDCNNIFCRDRVCRKDSALVCSQCDKLSCRWCNKNGEGSVKWCEMEDRCDLYCDDCRYISCRGGDNGCQCCKGMVFDRLLQESTVQATEMDRLRAENAELRRAQESENRREPR